MAPADQLLPADLIVSLLCTFSPTRPRVIRMGGAEGRRSRKKNAACKINSADCLKSRHSSQLWCDLQRRERLTRHARWNVSKIHLGKSPWKPFLNRKQDLGWWLDETSACHIQANQSDLLLSKAFWSKAKHQNQAFNVIFCSCLNVKTVTSLLQGL